MGDPHPLEQSLRDVDATLARLLAVHAAGVDPADVHAIRKDLQPSLDALRAATETLSSDARLGRLAQGLAGLFASSSGPQAFCHAALDAIAADMRAERAWVVTFDDDLAGARVLAERRGGADAVRAELPISRSLLARIAHEGAPILLADASEADHGPETSVVQLGLKSTLLAPLLAPLPQGRRVAGAIGLENSTLAGVFTGADREALVRVAALLAPYLHASLRLDDAIEEGARLDAAVRGESHYRDLVGESPAMRGLVTTIEKLASSDAPVLVTGESGTGKELIARALHYSGRRRQGRLVAVNCAAIPEGLMESELFGHERGAFTGATEKRKGKLELAQGGTLFLDEVGELRPDLQAKLLRALQERQFERVGGTETIEMDARVIAATHRDLAAMVEAGTFREDLYWRLDLVPIRVPPLRERPEDVAPLARHFLAELGREAGRDMTFGPGVLERLAEHPFRGNVRELRNLVQWLVALAESDVVRVEDLPPQLSGLRAIPLDKDPLKRFLRLDPKDGAELKALRGQMQETLDHYLRRVEERFFRALLERSGGSVSEAARVAGLNRTALHRKLKELGIE